MEPVSLSVVVMAHPSRERHFSYLREILGEDVPFSIDQNNNLLENAKAAWRMHDMTKDFAVTIQDDAVPVDNFRERAAAFITEQEERRIQAGRPAQGYNFFLKQDNKLTPLWPKDGAYMDNVTRAGIAICLPVAHIKPMLVEFDRQHSRHDDDRISEYAKRNGMKILFPVPSLVNHRIDQPSLANNPIGFEAWKMDGCEPVTIPKIIHQLWVGPHPRPAVWMDSWKEKHPGWEYRLWDNDAVFSRQWINQKWIDYFRARQMWPGVSDVCTYEILHAHGGFMPGADAVCLAPVDELFYNDYDSYGVWENEKIRPGLMSPLHASVKGGAFAKELIEGLKNRTPNNVPWKTVGNAYMGEMFRKTKAKVKIFPSHYFIPEHFLGETYTGSDKIYARQMWGSTTRSYTAGIAGREKACDDFLSDKPEVIVKNIFGIGKVVKQ